MRLVDMDDPAFLLPRLGRHQAAPHRHLRHRTRSRCSWTGARCRAPDNPMKGFFSLPQVLGHEVVADVVALGPEAEGLEVGDRVVLNPWLSCGPRGVHPVCPACEVGDYSLCCVRSRVGPIAPGIHTGTSKDASGGYADADAGARLDAVQGPRRRARRARRVRRPVRGVVARDHPPPAGRRAAR